MSERGVAEAGPSDVVRRIVVVCNRRGLHARAAARFVKLASTFEATITVVKDETEVSGRSIMGLMMLAAAPGTPIELRARGPQALTAVTALAQLVAGRFDED